jgi:hypothetical protein
VNNKQIEIILESLKPEELHSYLLDTFYSPIKVIKDNIAKGLKSMKLPIADEDLIKIKTTFMKYEMIIDHNLSIEESMLEELVINDNASHKFTEVLKSQTKEMDIAKVLLDVLNQSKATCQVYELLRQLLYKTEDRMDITMHLLNKNE